MAAAQLVHPGEPVVEADVHAHSRGSVGATDGSGDGELLIFMFQTRVFLRPHFNECVFVFELYWLVWLDNQTALLSDAPLGKI